MCWLSAVFLSSTNYGGCEVFVLGDMNDEIGKEREREKVLINLQPHYGFICLLRLELNDGSTSYIMLRLTLHIFHNRVKSSGRM